LSDLSDVSDASDLSGASEVSRASVHGPSGGETFRLSLGIPDDDLVSCVACGLCLPHCPTYRVTLEESASPRGRIALMNMVDKAGFADASFSGFMDACIQCRGCETACPAAVPFGSMMERTREALADQTNYQPKWRRAGFWFLGRPRLLRAGSSVLAVVQRMRLVPKRLGLPPLSVTRPKMVASPGASAGDEDVIVFTGCVMDAWMRDTHVATVKVLEALGLSVRVSGDDAPCCGALQSHAGLGDQARARARETVEGLAGDTSILVNSAGCGAQLKNLGELLGDDAAQAFEARVFDIHEYLAGRIADLRQLGPGGGAERKRIAVQDPCHLRHVQRNHQFVHEVLAPFFEPVALDDEGLCCGAGGAYSVMHPETAALVRDRKVASIERSGCKVVASANPGCLMHLRSAGLDVRHPIDLIADAITT